MDIIKEDHLAAIKTEMESGEINQSYGRSSSLQDQTTESIKCELI